MPRAERSPAVAREPISTLLSQLLVALTIEFDNEAAREIAESGYSPAVGVDRALRRGEHARRPYVTQTDAMIRDPWGSLPHYPMVLHRGGYPDGS